MPFEAAPAPLTDQQKINAVLTKLSEDNMKALTAMFETMSRTNDDKIEKHKRDLSNQLKADVTTSTEKMETRVDSIDIKVADVESDIQGFKLDVDNLEAFQTEVTPKIDQAITRPASSATSLDARNDFPRFCSGYMGTSSTLQKTVPPDKYYKQNRIDRSDSTLQLSTDIENCINDGTSEFTGDVPGIKIVTTSPFKLEPVETLLPPPSPPTENVDFPHFSGYMGTTTNIHPTLSPATFSKFLLPARTSTTGSYVDHRNPLQDGLFPFANPKTISNVGRFMKNLKDLPACGDDPPLFDRLFYSIGGLQFTPKNFFSFLVCTSADDSTGLPPEQGLFSFVNHTIFLTSADL
jgi:hypothetical protein